MELITKSSLKMRLVDSNTLWFFGVFFFFEVSYGTDSKKKNVMIVFELTGCEPIQIIKKEMK